MKGWLTYELTTPVDVHGALLFSPPVRSVLGCMVCLSLIGFLRAVRSWLGPLVSSFALLLTMVQFHFLFYASRTLPNTFALVLGVCV